jgi:beta-galactosidase
MKKGINHMRLEHYHENPEILHVNTSENRCYYIPRDLNGKEMRRMLNGKWKFQFFHNVDEAEEFIGEDFQMNSLADIDVPSNWQFYGYDHHQYTNICYPFPFDPPYVPDDNPCGVYLKTISFTGEETAKKLFLNFEGVDSCFY